MLRLKLTIAYVGTDFHGWQIQLRKDKILPTIQGILEERVAHIVGHHVHIHGAGRTDAGVHAAAQIAHMDVPENKVSLNWQLALNTSLPASIRIVDVAEVESTFHAQHQAVRKCYEYRLWLSRRYTPPWLIPFVWSCGSVQIAPMDEAAKYLLGTHDFASLCNAGTHVLTTVRTMLNISHNSEAEEFLPLPENQSLLLTWRFEADGFLKQMVRNCMGLLVASGQGKIQPHQVPDILEAKDRRVAPLTAPPQGLMLKKIWYA